MILLDTSIVIYYQDSRYPQLQKTLRAVAHGASLVTKLETLGYTGISRQEQQEFGVLFSVIPLFEVSEDIINRAITIRQQKKVSVGDAIIAATALEHDLELWTNNTRDFEGIAGLKLHNPIQTIST